MNKAITRFTAWYESKGHWMYDSRAEALDGWIRRGINTLPDAPANAKALLKDWAA